MLEKLRKMLYGKEKLQNEELSKDIELIERIAGVKFKEVPEIHIISSKEISKITKNELGIGVEACAYNIRENKVYLPKGLKKNPYLFDFEKAHELAHALFYQHSLASNLLKETYNEEFYIFGNYLFDYLTGKLDSKEIEENGRELLDRITLVALDEGFANLMGRVFLIEKYGMEEGFIKGVEYTNFDPKILEALPPSNYKLSLVLLQMGTIFANHHFLIKAQEVFKRFLNISESELPEVRKNMIKLYSRLFEG